MKALNNIRVTSPLIVNGSTIYAHPVHWRLPEEGYSHCRRCVVDVLDVENEIVRLRAVEVPVSQVALAFEWAAGRMDAPRVEFKADLVRLIDFSPIWEYWRVRGGGVQKHEPITSRRLSPLLEEDLVEVRDGWGGVAKVRVSPRRAAVSDGAGGADVRVAGALVGVLAVQNDPLLGVPSSDRVPRRTACTQGDPKGRRMVRP